MNYKNNKGVAIVKETHTQRYSYESMKYLLDKIEKEIKCNIQEENIEYTFQTDEWISGYTIGVSDVLKRVQNVLKALELKQDAINKVN